MPYIARALDLAKPYFSNLKIEVMPLKAEEYEELTHHGMNGVICFQETYNRAHYRRRTTAPTTTSIIHGA